MENNDLSPTKKKFMGEELANNSPREKLAELDNRERLLLLQNDQHNKLKVVNEYQQYLKLKRQLEDLVKKSENYHAESVLKNKSVTVKELSEIATQRQITAYALSDYEIKLNQLNKRKDEATNFANKMQQQKAEILQERSRLTYLQKKGENRQPQKLKKIQITFASFIPLIILEAFFLLGGLILREKSPGLSTFFIVLAVLLPFLMVIFYFILQKKQENNYHHYQNALRKYEKRTLEIANQLKVLEWELKRYESRQEDFQHEIFELEEELNEKKILLDKEKKKLKFLIKPFFTELPNDDQLDIAIQILREQTVDTVQHEESIQNINLKMSEIIGQRSAKEFYEDYQEAQNWLIDHQDHLRAFPEFEQGHIRAQLEGIANERKRILDELNKDENN